MARKPKSEDELKIVAEHVCYEIWMLHHMGKALAFGLSGQGPIYNAFIESFAVHVRNIISFLWDDKPENDMVTAVDFCGSGKDWKIIRPQQTARLKKAAIRAHKQVAHITYTRSRKESWDFLGILQDIHRALVVFIASIDVGLLGAHYGPIEPYFRKSPS